MLDEVEAYRLEQYHAHAPVYGLMLNEDNSTRSRVLEDGTAVPLSAMARLCYTVMKSFGPTFKASRRAVATRMGVNDVNTVSRCQEELEGFGLLRSEPSSIGEPRKWTVLEPQGRKVPVTPPVKPTGHPMGLTHGSPTPPSVKPMGVSVKPMGPVGLTDTEAVNKAVKKTSIDLKVKPGKWELKALLSPYYELFDPRHPGFSEARDNTQLKTDWEALNGPWSPKPQHPEDHR